MQDIFRTILRFENKDNNELSQDVRESIRSAYEYTQRSVHKDVYYLGWIPFYNEEKKVYNTPYYFVFLEKISDNYVYLEFIFQNYLWFDIYKKVHVNNLLFASDLETFAVVSNYKLNTDKLNMGKFKKFGLAIKYDTDVYYS